LLPFSSTTTNSMSVCCAAKFSSWPKGLACGIGEPNGWYRCTAAVDGIMLYVCKGSVVPIGTTAIGTTWQGWVGQEQKYISMRSGFRFSAIAAPAEWLHLHLADYLD
jgi:hypothetical protein